MCFFWDNVEKYCAAGQGTDDNMANAHCLLDTYGYKHTCIVCNIYCFSTTTMFTRTRLSVTLFIYCLSFYIILIVWNGHSIWKKKFFRPQVKAWWWWWGGVGGRGSVQRLRLAPCIRHSSVGISPAIYRRMETAQLPFGMLRILSSETELFIFWYANCQNSLDFVRLLRWLNVNADPVTSCWHCAQVGVCLWKFRRKHVSPSSKQHDQIYKLFEANPWPPKAFICNSSQLSYQ